MAVESDIAPEGNGLRLVLSTDRLLRGKVSGHIKDCYKHTELGIKVFVNDVVPSTPSTMNKDTSQEIHRELANKHRRFGMFLISRQEGPPRCQESKKNQDSRTDRQKTNCSYHKARTSKEVLLSC